MFNKVDTRGRSCPEPVLMAKKAMGQFPQGITVIVDNNTAKENVKRFAENSKYKVEITSDGPDYILTISR